MIPLPAVALGLVGSTHCALMCGGIVAASQVSQRHTLPAFRPRLTIVLTQNLGRLVSYVVAGAAAGALGELAAIRGAVTGRLVLEAAAGLALLVAGATLAGMLPAAWSPERLGAPLWRLVGPRARALLPLTTPTRGFAFGLLWGFVPCGLVYSALSLAATSGTMVGGALTMLGFAVGTLPVLLGLGAMAAQVAMVLRRPLVRQLAGLAVAGLGLVQLVVVAHAVHSPHSCCPQLVLRISEGARHA